VELKKKIMKKGAKKLKVQKKTSIYNSSEGGNMRVTKRPHSQREEKIMRAICI